MQGLRGRRAAPARTARADHRRRPGSVGTSPCSIAKAPERMVTGVLQHGQDRSGSPSIGAEPRLGLHPRFTSRTGRQRYDLILDIAGNVARWPGAARADPGRDAGPRRRRRRRPLDRHEPPAAGPGTGSPFARQRLTMLISRHAAPIWRPSPGSSKPASSRRSSGRPTRWARHPTPCATS